MEEISQKKKAQKISLKCSANSFLRDMIPVQVVIERLQIAVLTNDGVESEWAA